MRYEDQGAQERTGKAGKRGDAGKDQKVLGDMNRRGRGSAYASVNVAGMHNVEELIGIGDELRVVEFEPNKYEFKIKTKIKKAQMMPGGVRD